ncbi:MAG: hypothetical protein Ct9H300mP20_12410 [Gammaproteobacteria bacterium]|nr:MAG: hypothetical protein Ct9H300mP20_12410 [Gammaproteobacteria bacterium]
MKNSTEQILVDITFLCRFDSTCITRAFLGRRGLYAFLHTVVEYDNHYEKTDIIAQISDIFELPGGPVDIVVGYEGFDNNYSAQYDKHSEGGLVGGSAGNSGAGKKSG